MDKKKDKKIKATPCLRELNKNIQTHADIASKFKSHHCSGNGNCHITCGKGFGLQFMLHYINHTFLYLDLYMHMITSIPVRFHCLLMMMRQRWNCVTVNATVENPGYEFHYLCSKFWLGGCIVEELPTGDSMEALLPCEKYWKLKKQLRKQIRCWYGEREWKKRWILVREEATCRCCLDGWATHTHAWARLLRSIFPWQLPCPLDTQARTCSPTPRNLQAAVTEFTNWRRPFLLPQL